MFGLIVEYFDEMRERVGRTVEDIGAKTTINLHTVMVPANTPDRSTRCSKPKA